MAAAAGEEGLAQVLANGSSMSIDAVRAAGIRPNQPLFQQVYVNKDIQKSEETVRRAVKAGASGIWITVDSPVVGKREMDERLNLEVQVIEYYGSFESEADFLRHATLLPKDKASQRPWPAPSHRILTGIFSNGSVDLPICRW